MGQCTSAPTKKTASTVVGNQCETVYINQQINTLQQGMRPNTPTEWQEPGFRCIRVPEFPNYQSRPAEEKLFLESIKKVADNPENGVFMVYGGSGIGKSSLVSNILHNQNDVLENLFDTAIWMNCYRWRNGITAATRDQFEQELLSIAATGVTSKREADEWSGLKAMVTYFKNAKRRRVMVFLDDCFHFSIIRIFRESAETSTPCAVITQNPYKLRREAIGAELEVGFLEDDQIVQLFKLQPYELDAKLKDDEKLLKLAHKCCGSPLVASLTAGCFASRAGSLDPEATYSKLVTHKTSLANLETAAALYREVETAGDLFLIAMNELTEEEMRFYFIFLLFEPAHAVRLHEIATLRMSTVKRTRKILLAMEGMALVKATNIKVRSSFTDESEEAFAIHQILHEAGIHLAQKWLFQEGSNESRLGRYSSDDVADCRLRILAMLSQLTVNFSEFSDRKQLITTVLQQSCEMSQKGLGKMLFEIYSSFETDYFKQFANLKVQTPYAFLRGTSSVQRNRTTMVHAAAKHGDVSLVELACNWCPNFDGDEEGRSALSLAAEAGHVEVVMLLADRSCGARTLSSDSRTPFQTDRLTLRQLFRRQRQHYSKDKRYVKQAATQDDRGSPQMKNNRSVAFYAASNGHAEILRALLETQPASDFFQKDEYGRTPLFIAASKGHLECVKILADEFGATKTAPDEYGRTPQQAAKEHGHVDVAKFLEDDVDEIWKLIDSE